MPVRHLSREMHMARRLWVVGSAPGNWFQLSGDPRHLERGVHMILMTEQANYVEELTAARLTFRKEDGIVYLGVFFNGICDPIQDR